MISQTAEYALRAVVCLANRPGTPQTTSQIAEMTQVPAGYLAKVLQSLSRGGLVQSQRGLHGGSILSRPPEEITVLEVINAVDPIKRIQKCPLGMKAHASELCPLHRSLDEAAALVEEAFGSHTLADLLGDPSASRPLDMARVCAGPVPVATHETK